MGSPHCVSAYVGNPLVYVDVVDGVAGPPRLRRELPVSEPAADAAGTDDVREYPDSDGSTLSGTLAAALKLLRVSQLDNRVSGAAGRLLRLLREVVVVVLLPRLVLVLRELATLGLVMRELVTLAAPSPSWS